MAEYVTEAPRRTPSHSVVAASATAVTLFSEDADPTYVTIANNADVDMWVLLGAVADVGAVTTTDNFTVQLEPQQFYEPQYPFTGTIQGIWAAAPTGDAQVTIIAE